MKRMILFAATLLASAAIVVPSVRADSCRAAGAICLFSDGSGCAITCGAGYCAKCVTAGCILGFGYDAECTCFRCPWVLDPVPQTHGAGALGR